MVLNAVITRNKVNFRLCAQIKNKAKTKPIQSQKKPISKNGEIDITSFMTSKYGDFCDFRR